jgi:hypothetical protein
MPVRFPFKKRMLTTYKQDNEKLRNILTDILDRLNNANLESDEKVVIEVNNILQDYVE